MSDHLKTDDPRMTPELRHAILEGRRILDDPHWNGGGAVCGRTQAICSPMDDGPNLINAGICKNCGHPISWHDK
jgi:hypothetical protein